MLYTRAADNSPTAWLLEAASILQPPCRLPTFHVGNSPMLVSSLMSKVSKLRSWDKPSPLFALLVSEEGSSHF